ncbi:DISARM system helicase DrmA [Thiohalobacter sp. COW1]|uniref:DISARM system helicase DrmA n=1 Tax=Thiohalobacter sp. COW1 TaxID=2795687 RepID=UPI0019156F4A|nr:DISARM system helicase DrmA [Thiohalobacter sp. COW1]
MIVDETAGGTVAFGRVYRVRATLDEVTFFFDGVERLSPPMDPGGLGVTLPASTAAITRLDWPVFSGALRTAAGIEFSTLPVLPGDTPQEQAYVRELLELATMDDLLGPAGGPFEEIVEMSVRDRYLVGKIAPLDTAVPDDQVEDLSDAAGPDGDGGDRETDATTNQSLMPSSVGLTFCVDGKVESLEIEARWGRYERGESELHMNEETGKPLRAWKRIPSGGRTALSMREGVIDPLSLDTSNPEVVVQGTIRPPLENGDRLVTLFLVNTQTRQEENQDAAWTFQPELIVRDPKMRPVFLRKPLLWGKGADPEREALEMIYRKRVEFAVGHGVSVHARTAKSDVERAVEVRTVVLPRYEVAVTETPGTAQDDRPAMRRIVEEGWLDMKSLADMERARLVEVLSLLTDDYGVWIAEQRDRIGKDVVGYDSSAAEALDRCGEVLNRLLEGVNVLGTDNDALEAFRFANRVMAAQRVRSIYSLERRRGGAPDLASLDITANRSWRPFQLAFILLSIPALADPTHRDRTEPLEAYADLLWFPTGGGKTEAYLGVAAFTMAIRRLQGNLGGLDGGRGLAVIMRYTLRLLTLQQFQRATALICAMEVHRRSDPETWGTEPFTIGLWVGQRVTPNSTEESHQAIEKERDGRYGSGSTPAQLTNCPWCGSEIASGRDIRVHRDVGRTTIYCGDKLGRCDFSHARSKNLGLPVSVVDDEIYRRPPSMIVATVDKFAMMAWRGQVRNLFGKATQECPRHGLLWPEADCTGNHQKKGFLPPTHVRSITPIRPPDLIIQDEFHLISGPLGTMVGLYETAVDELSTWSMDGNAIRPKIIASTATVRKAAEQVNDVFLRRVSVFPPHGLDVEDNFFSVQRPITDKPGRRYLGICSPGSSRPAVLIRVYVALLTASQALFDRFGQAADPYMTAVGYFNSLRELGGMRRLAEDDVQARAFRVLRTRTARPGLAQRSVDTIDELTSRVQSRDIPTKLDRLEVKFKPVWQKGETRAVDVVLATNMLSVGVDVNRLGLMAVNGQPKNTAEYIQATSRVGRASPGLVCTVFNWARPRDLSHYETFEHYHATFYKHVEAQSVTPYAPRALDRGLTGAMVSLIRLTENDLNPNLGAEQMNSTGRPEVGRTRRTISDRAWMVTDRKPVRDLTETMVSDRFDRWVKEACKGGRRLGYETERRQGDVVALLKKPGVQVWDELTVPMSMREVEPGVQLVMDEARLPDPPAWRVRVRNDAGDGGDS